MEFEEIPKKSIDQISVPPNLADYDELRQTFRWETLHNELDWLPQGGLNMAYECIDRHAATQRRDKLAMIWIGKNGEEAKEGG